MPLHIDELFAFIAPDAEGEGLTAFRTADGWMPMVAADPTRVDGLRKVAQMIADATGKSVTLARFSVRENVEVIRPHKPP